MREPAQNNINTYLREASALFARPTNRAMRRPLKAGRAASMALTLFLSTNLMPMSEPGGK